MRRIDTLMALAGATLLALGTSGATAQAADPVASHTLSLSAEQKAALLAGHSETSVDAARAGLGDDAPAGGVNDLGAGGGRRQIHGEIDAMVGTNGARGIAGTAAVPLGDNAGAVVSFESSRFGRIR